MTSEALLSIISRSNFYAIACMSVLSYPAQAAAAAGDWHTERPQIRQGLADIVRSTNLLT